MQLLIVYFPGNVSAKNIKNIKSLHVCHSYSVQHKCRFLFTV